MNKVIGEKEKNIFGAVLALADRGVDLSSVKMQEIAAEADVGKSTLYEYFSSKEELLTATMSFCLQQEVELLAPQVEHCGGFNRLIDVFFCYIDGLVRERVAAYSMLGQVFGGKQPEDQCPMFRTVSELFDQLMNFAAALAKQDGFAADDVEYFSHVLFSTMMSHAITLLRMKNMGLLSDREQEKLCEKSRRMLLKALQ